MRTNRAWHPIMMLLAGGCIAGQEDAHEDGVMPVIGGAEDADGKALLDRMGERYPEVRRLKAELAIGESADGWLAVPPGASASMDDPSYSAHALAVLDEENADRSVLYDREVARQRESIEAQVQEQLPALRDEVVRQLCIELPPGTPCDQIAERVLAAALDAALQAAIDAALAQVRLAVQRVHAAFWQRKTTRPGEWIEVEVAPGELEWIARPVY